MIVKIFTKFCVNNSGKAVCNRESSYQSMNVFDIPVNLNIALHITKFISKLIIARQTTLAIEMFENWKYDIE